ncbi:MAG: DUF362 domain-containing protein, partial [Clostridiales bacterium]|nr:DUF362 domain-containing protein [Clostridiales bacterium]
MMPYVSIVKCPDYEQNNINEAIEATFNLLGGISQFVKPGMRVALKPNLVMRKHPDEAVTTHPELVRAVGKAIKAAGGIPFIVESPGGPYTPQALKSIYSGCGMDRISNESDIGLNYDVTEIEVPFPEGKILKRITIIKPLMNADLIINLPKFKTHGMMLYTGAVKNMFGAIPGVLKAEFHLKMQNYDDFANALIDIYLCTKPHLNIMDAVVAMEGQGPASGDKRHLGLIMASEDGFDLDLAALGIVGAKYSLINMIRCAVERGLCKDDHTKISYIGVRPANISIDNFHMPQFDALKSVQFTNNRIAGYFIEKLRPSPVFDYSICIGCGICAQNCPAKVIEMKIPVTAHKTHNQNNHQNECEDREDMGTVLLS